MKDTRYYKTFSDDFVESKNQNYKLPSNYKWIHKNKIHHFLSKIVYIIAYIFSFFYCKFVLHVSIKNRKILKENKDKGYFVYGNHTQPIGDAFLPALVCSPKHIYTVVSPANLGIPILGKLLPIMGALPIPDTSNLTSMKSFMKAIFQRIHEKKCVIIYPEAHVWPYYTKIRPFPITSFKFPVKEGTPSYAMTVTYHKRKLGSKPKIIVYIDGPFLPEKTLDKKEQEIKLRDDIYKCMVNRSLSSTYSYIQYKEEK